MSASPSPRHERVTVFHQGRLPRRVTRIEDRAAGEALVVEQIGDGWPARDVLKPHLVKDGVQQQADPREAASAAAGLVGHGASVLLGVG